MRARLVVGGQLELKLERALIFIRVLFTIDRFADALVLWFDRKAARHMPPQPNIQERVVELRAKIRQKVELKWRKQVAAAVPPPNTAIVLDPKAVAAVFLQSRSGSTACKDVAYFLPENAELYLKWADTLLKGIQIGLAGSDPSIDQDGLAAHEWRSELCALIIQP